MLKIKSYFLALLVAAAFVSGCTEETTPSGGGGSTSGGTTTTPEPFKAIAPDFNADSAFVYIEKQLAFGPRIPNTAGHAAAAAWFVEKFREFGAEVTVQAAQVTAWDKTIFNIQNIIANYNPAADKRIIVSAHWDSRPFADKDPVQPMAPVPAANDGGSGVAVILEMARQMGQKAPDAGIDFILWDAEDYGQYQIDKSWCLGSQYWAKNRHKAGYRAQYGINLDMVGASNAHFVKDGYSLQYAKPQVDRVWSMAYQLGYGAYFPLVNLDFASVDDHYYIMEMAGIPMVEIIDRNMQTGEFFPHWHKTTDDINQIDKATLKATGQTVMEVLYRE